MYYTGQEVLLNILTIINYSKNKQAFVDEFIAINHLDAIAEFTDRLPQEFKEKKVLTQADREVMKQYVSPEEYAQVVERISRQALNAFIHAISPTLNLQQKEQIKQLMAV